MRTADGRLSIADGQACIPRGLSAILYFSNRQSAIGNRQ
jgi:hypothetical protein